MIWYTKSKHERIRVANNIIIWEEHVRGTSRKIKHIEPVLGYCWPSVVDDVPTLNQHGDNAVCLPGFVPYIMSNVTADATNTRRWTNAGLMLAQQCTTLGRHQTNIGSTSCACWGEGGGGECHRNTPHLTSSQTLWLTSFACNFVLSFRIVTTSLLQTLRALSYLNSHPLEVVCRLLDPQLQVGENYKSVETTTILNADVDTHTLLPNDSAI